MEGGTHRKVLAQAEVLGMGRDQASRVELQDVAVAVFGHPVGSSVVLEGVLIPCPLSYPKLGGRRDNPCLLLQGWEAGGVLDVFEVLWRLGLTR